MTGIERKRGRAETMLMTCMVRVATFPVLHDGISHNLKDLYLNFCCSKAITYHFLWCSAEELVALAADGRRDVKERREKRHRDDDDRADRDHRADRDKDR